MALIAVCALVINIVLFVIMENMINRDSNRLINTYEAHTIEFVRTQIEDQTKKKDRRKKPPPKPQEAKKPKALLDDLFNQTMELPTPVASMDIKSLLTGNGIALGGHLVDGAAEALIDTVLENELTPISRLPPRYPQQAAIEELEGYVRVLILIRSDGTVGEAKVVEAKPKGVFEREAIAAVRRWRYKPVTRNGQPATVRAYITMDFELEDE